MKEGNTTMKATRRDVVKELQGLSLRNNDLENAIETAIDMGQPIQDAEVFLRDALKSIRIAAAYLYNARVAISGTDDVENHILV